MSNDFWNLSRIDEGGKTVSLGAGTYTFTVEATVLQDLPSTGSNEIRVAIGIVEL